MIDTQTPHADAKSRAIARLTAAARPAVEAALGASLAVYDRAHALARFHRLSQETTLSETPEAARLVLKEIDRALRAERARSGHVWTPPSTQEEFGSGKARDRVRSCIRPLIAAGKMPRARMGFEDQVHITGARSKRYPCAWFS